MLLLLLDHLHLITWTNVDHPSSCVLDHDLLASMIKIQPLAYCALSYWVGTNPYLVVHSISLLMTPSMTLTALLVPVYLPHHLLPLLLHHGTQLG